MRFFDSVAGRPLVASIDRSAFLHNLRYAESLSPMSETLVVLKANAYGHGAVALAKCVGNRRLAVACASEAKTLIDAGVRNPIMVLEGPFDESCVKLSESSQITWVIHSRWQLNLLSKSTKNHSIWLKLDTGMHRLGLSSAELAMAIRDVDTAENISIVGLFSHFASADEKNVGSVVKQINQLDRLSEQFGLSDLPISLANSGALMHYADAHRHLSRPGIMLYGGLPNNSDLDRVPQLKAVMNLDSAIIALREIGIGESVGYGASWTAQRKSIIATIAIGYGDGYPRHAPNGTPVLIKQKLMPLVGRVSMDMITVDVTDLGDARVGDVARLWGDGLSADQIAKHAGTISYELFTQLTMRVPRQYK
jgi:alanine racemase